MAVERSAPYGGGFDPHFSVFYELMNFRVREILLVASPYDAYIMEEDGSPAQKIINEYHGHNLSRPPRITGVATVAEARELLERKNFDLVLAMPNLGGMDCNTFGGHVKELHPDMPVILLTHSVHEAQSLKRGRAACYIDDIYVWGGDADILLAIVKQVEDRKNVDFDTERAMVRVILLVEDSPLERSRILPILYSELVRQTQRVLDESLNEQHRLLRMRARPKILSAGTYEQAMDLFTRYLPHIFAVLSDVRYPRKGVMAPDAGLRFMRKVRRRFADLPILMLSSEETSRDRAESLPAVFALKGSRSLREEVHDFFRDHLGFGEFVFRLPDGREVGRAANLHEFEQRLKTIPVSSLLYHARRNHFSHWMMARAEVALAARLHKNRFRESSATEDLREEIGVKVHALRKLRQRGVVTRFVRDGFDPEVTDFVRIGTGSMGGKARGIAFVRTRLQAADKHSILRRARVRVPGTCVITTDGFDDFVRRNSLRYVEGQSDGDIIRRFEGAVFPDWFRDDLRAYLTAIDHPLSVRSSSMLEDAQFRPYAGLYSTFMLPNSHPDFEVRFQQLLRAVTLVYASTWFEGARVFSRAGGRQEEDIMAVILQELVGADYGGHFYPALSGVGQSYNYYPVPPMTAEDGVACIALGFGKTVVEGERSLCFSPAFPEHLPQFSTPDDMLGNSQYWFYSLDISDPAAFTSRNSNLCRRGLEEALDEQPVRLLCSTYFPEEHRVRDGDLPGPKVLTFAPLLKYGYFSLAEVIAELSTLGRQGLGCEVELEFALHLDPVPARSVFYVLQVRPLAVGGARQDVRISRQERKNAVIYSDRVLGHGRYPPLQDILYVRPEVFDPAATRKIAEEIRLLNSTLSKEGRPYLLIGFGRWGTAAPRLGIPVRWHDISGVGAMVEVHGCGIVTEPSRGTHFFQNITSLDIPCLTVMESGCAGRGGKAEGGGVDWQWLAAQEAVREKKYVRHVRPAAPLVVKVNGRTSRAVVVKGGGIRNAE